MNPCRGALRMFAGAPHHTRLWLLRDAVLGGAPMPPDEDPVSRDTALRLVRQFRAE